MIYLVMKQTKKGLEKYLVHATGSWTKNKAKAWYMSFSDAIYYSGYFEGEITL